MKIEGKPVRVPQWIHGEGCVVKVWVDAVVLPDDPSEPCLEPETLKHLDEVQRLANEGDLDALAKLGDVFVRRSA
jgi:hypothetical protein